MNERSLEGTIWSKRHCQRSWSIGWLYWIHYFSWHSTVPDGGWTLSYAKTSPLCREFLFGWAAEWGRRCANCQKDWIAGAGGADLRAENIGFEGYNFWVGEGLRLMKRGRGAVGVLERDCEEDNGGEHGSVCLEIKQIWRMIRIVLFQLTFMLFLHKKWEIIPPSIG